MNETLMMWLVMHVMRCRLNHTHHYFTIKQGASTVRDTGMTSFLICTIDPRDRYLELKLSSVCRSD